MDNDSLRESVIYSPDDVPLGLNFSEFENPMSTISCKDKGYIE